MATGCTEPSSCGAARSRAWAPGVDVDGCLRDDAMQRVFYTLDEYKAEIDQHDCERGVAVLTSAVRDSANGAEFAEQVRPATASSPTCSPGRGGAADLSGRHQRARPQDRTPTLVFDIGGRLDRDGDRCRAPRSPSTSPPRPGWCARPNVTCTTTRQPRPSRMSSSTTWPDPRRGRPGRAARRASARDRRRRHRDLAGRDRPGPRPLRPGRVHGYELSAEESARSCAAGDDDARGAPRGGAAFTPTGRRRSSPAS